MPRQLSDDEVTFYTHMGYGAMIAGLQVAVDLLQAKLDEARAVISGATEPLKRNADTVRKNKYGVNITPKPARRTAKQTEQSAAMKKRWADMSPAKRKAWREAIAAGRRRMLAAKKVTKLVNGAAA